VIALSSIGRKLTAFWTAGDRLRHCGRRVAERVALRQFLAPDLVVDLLGRLAADRLRGFDLRRLRTAAAPVVGHDRETVRRFVQRERVLFVAPAFGAIQRFCA
jgi:hypothetical protein